RAIRSEGAGMEPIIWLDASAHGGEASAQADEAAAHALGGKARGPVRLLRAGLPVPPGFVIRADAPPRGEATPATHDEALPAPLARAVRQAYARLGRRLGEPQPLVAV